MERFRALLRSQSKILEASIESLDPEKPEGAPVDRQASAEIPVTEVTDAAFNGEQALFPRENEGSGAPHGS